MAAALTLAGCGSGGDEPAQTVPQTEQHSMAFGAQEGAAASRASQDGRSQANSSRTETDLQKNKQFQVWGSKYLDDGSTQEVFPGYIVKWDDTKGWYYEDLTNPSLSETQYLKYWDASAAHYIFDAVAYNEAWASNLSCSNGQVTITNITTGTHWLVAKTKRTIASPADEDMINDENKFSAPSNYHSDVPLRFYHLLAEVEFKVYAQTADGNYEEIKITEFKAMTTDYLWTEVKYSYNVLTGTPLDLANVTMLQRQASGLAFIENGSTTTIDDEYDPKTVGETTVVPQQFATRDLMVTFKANNRPVSSATLTINGGWKPNTHYVYILRYEPFVDTVILVDVEEQPYEWGGEQEETQTNW